MAVPMPTLPVLAMVISSALAPFKILKRSEVVVPVFAVIVHFPSVPVPLPVLDVLWRMRLGAAAELDARMLPPTSSFCSGVVAPIPTFPAESMRMRSLESAIPLV